MSNTVYVKNISTSTSEKEIKEFFSFCGKISKIEVTPAGETQNATVTFEKETAAKTALLLDNTQLGRTQVSVSGAEGAKEYEPTHGEKDTDEITQEEKPRSRIIAEYLAHGYAIGDQAAQRALDLDKKHGVTNKFLQTLHNLDSKYKATEKAKTADQSYGITARVQGVFNTLASYYDKAASTPSGQKLVNFYTQTAHEVADIHAEARRLADLKKEETGAQCKCGAESSKCTCAPGTCNCASCAKNGKSKKPLAPGSSLTVCSCGGNEEVCSCEPGRCACKKCPRSNTGCAQATCDKKDCCEKTTPHPVAGSNQTTCSCGGDASICGCEKGKCACSNCPKSSASSSDCGQKKCSEKDCCKKTTAIPIAGTDKTKCECAGNEKICACEKGKCACSNCPKSSASSSDCGQKKCSKKDCDDKKCSEKDCCKKTTAIPIAGTDKTKCECAGNEKICACEKGKCACASCPKSQTSTSSKQ